MIVALPLLLQDGVTWEDILIFIGLLLLVQIIIISSTKANTPIHDKLAHTVTVDFASQMIFDTTEDMIAYKKRIHAEQVEAEKN